MSASRSSHSVAAAQLAPKLSQRLRRAQRKDKGRAKGGQTNGVKKALARLKELGL